MVVVAIMMGLNSFGKEVKIKNFDIFKNLPSNYLVHKGENYRINKDMPDSAFLCFSIVASRSFHDGEEDSTEVKSRIAAFHGLGLLYSTHFFDFQKFHFYMLKAERLATEHHYYSLLPSIHHNMLSLKKLDFSINRRGEQASELINDYKRVVHEAIEYNALYYLPMYVSTMADCAINANMADSVKPEIERFLKMKLPKTKIITQDIFRLHCLAILAYTNKDYENAFNYLDREKDSILASKDLSNRLSNLINNNHTRCQMLWNLGKDKDGLQLIKENLRLGQEADNHLLMCDAYNNLSLYYKDHNEEQLSRHYELLYYQEKNYIEEQNRLADAGKTQFLFEIEQLNREAEMMGIRDHAKSRILWIVCMFTVILICTLLMLYQKYRQVKEKNNQLFDKVQKLLTETEEKKALMAQPVNIPSEQQDDKPKYQRNYICETEKSELLHRIFMVMESSADVYSSDFSLPRLAILTDALPNYVSQVINEKYHCNFNTMLNEYRIREACRRINDQEHYGNQTLDSIAEGVGIRSRSTFVAAFKKFTGMTPSAYQKLAKTKV